MNRLAPLQRPPGGSEAKLRRNFVWAALSGALFECGAVFVQTTTVVAALAPTRLLPLLGGLLADKLTYQGLFVVAAAGALARGAVLAKLNLDPRHVTFAPRRKRDR